MVNGFHLQAVGWVVTRDVCWEIVRRFLGLRPRLPEAAFDGLGRGWERVERSARDDLSNAHSCWMSLIAPRRVPLSSRTEEALGAFLRQLALSCPDRYGDFALRRRRLDVLGRILGIALCAVLLVEFAPPSSTALARAELALLLIGGWSVAVAIQLWRMSALARRFVPQPLGQQGDSEPLHDH